MSLCLCALAPDVCDSPFRVRRIVHRQMGRPERRSDSKKGRIPTESEPDFNIGPPAKALRYPQCEICSENIVGPRGFSQIGQLSQLSTAVEQRFRKKIVILKKHRLLVIVHQSIDCDWTPLSPPTSFLLRQFSVLEFF